MPSRTYIRDARSPRPKDALTSRVMSANRGKNTRLELAVKKALREAGVAGYKSHVANLPGKPDLAFPKQKVAVFVHGCFWHRCPHCALGLPKTNRAFWKRKFEANRSRDARKSRELKKLGWKVVTVWECEVKKNADLTIKKRITPLLSRVRGRAVR